MKPLLLSSLLIVGASLSGCCTTGTCKAPDIWVSEECTVPPITVDESDVLTRGTQESIARTNERLREICVD